MGGNDNGEKTWFTWRNFVVTLFIIGILSILVWQLAPFEYAIDAILPEFNETSGTINQGDEGTTGHIGSSGDINSNSYYDDTANNGTTISPPTLAPTMDKSFKFNQCGENALSCCNGLGSICELRVDEVMFAGMHNAMATRENGFLFAPNHLFQLERALDEGYRAINLDVCNCGGQYQFCHGICSLGTRDITEVFLNMNRFLQDNPTEILLLSFQLSGDVDLEVDIHELYAMMEHVDGFTDKMYIHYDIVSSWPTMGTLKENNERLIIFHYNGPTCSDTPCPPGLHYYWDYAAETEYSFSSVEEIEDTGYSCSITRGARGSRAFFAVNNFITLPHEEAAEHVNTLDFASDRIRKCALFNGGLDVSILYVDFWSVGNIPELVQQHNEELGARRQLNGKLE